jgi:hypothetical protein
MKAKNTGFTATEREEMGYHEYLLGLQVREL